MGSWEPGFSLVGTSVVANPGPVCALCLYSVSAGPSSHAPARCGSVNKALETVERWGQGKTPKRVLETKSPHSF